MSEVINWRQNIHIKISVIILSCSIFLSIILSYIDSNLWPSLNIVVSIGVVGITGFIIYGSISHPSFLVVPIIIGIFFRTYTYMFPASLVGYDPDSYAILIQGIITTGSTDIISSTFYGTAPLFHILGGTMGVISQIPATAGMMIYPILSGIIFPLIAFLTARSLIDDRLASQRAGLISGLLASVGSSSIAFSYQPIAQLLAAMLWLVTTYIIICNLSSWSSKHTIIMTFLFTAIIFTHKLPLPVTVLSLFSTVSLTYISDRLFDMDILPHSRPAVSAGIFILILSILYVGVSYTLLTNTIENVALRFTPTAGETAAFYTTRSSYEAAVPIGGGIIQIAINRLHGLVLLPIAGLAWTILSLSIVSGGGLSQRMYPTIIVLTTTAVGVSLMIITLFSQTVSVSVARFLLPVEPFIIATIVVGFSKSNNLRAFVVLVLIFSQLFSGGIISPDYPKTEGNLINPDGTEMYLDKKSIHSKKFGYKYINNRIYTDFWLARETIPSNINTYTSGSNSGIYRSFAVDPLLNGRLKTKGYDFILLRNKDTFRTVNGWYKITRDPVTQVNTSYHKVYDNRRATLYSRYSQ